MKKLILFILILIFCNYCSPEFSSKFNHDKYNPCGVEYHNSIECENWKKQYPKEYARYKERVKNLSKGSN